METEDNPCLGFLRTRPQDDVVVLCQKSKHGRLGFWEIVLGEGIGRRRAAL